MQKNAKECKRMQKNAKGSRCWLRSAGSNCDTRLDIFRTFFIFRVIKNNLNEVF